MRHFVTDPRWQLEITVNSSSASFPLTNSQCGNVKWSVLRTREQRRCLTPRRLHLKAILEPSIMRRNNPSLFAVMFRHVNFHPMAPATFFCCHISAIFLSHIFFSCFLINLISIFHLQDMDKKNLQEVIYMIISDFISLISHWIESVSQTDQSQNLYHLTSIIPRCQKQLGRVGPDDTVFKKRMACELPRSEGKASQSPSVIILGET